MVERVYAIGGSVLTQKIGEIEQIGEAIEAEEQIAVVTGAGNLKSHINAVKESANQGQQDMIGIAATRLNARTLQVAMGSYPSIPEKPEEVLEAASSGEDVVMGGLVPGYSTDAVAATVAELFDAELYIVTNIDGVYDRDPEIEGAEKLDEVEVSELKQIIDGNNEAGHHALIDSFALEIIQRSAITTKVFEGSLENLEDPEGAEGTKVVSG